MSDRAHAWPWFLGGSLVVAGGGYLYLRRHDLSDWIHGITSDHDLAGESPDPAVVGDLPPEPSASAVIAPPPAELPGVWVWPLPILNGRNPVISDGWGSPRDGGTRRHEGVDVMYRRVSGLDDRWIAGSPFASKHHVLPAGVPVLAAHDATVWSGGWTPRGFTVVLDHGKDIGATYYTHMEQLLVTPTKAARSGQRVTAGEPIGYVGGDPMDPRHLRHLHFALWWKGGPHAAMDPASFMKRWRYLEAPAGTTPPSSTPPSTSTVVNLPWLPDLTITPAKPPPAKPAPALASASSAGTPTATSGAKPASAAPRSPRRSPLGPLEGLFPQGREAHAA